MLVALLAEKADVQYKPDETSPDVLVREIKSLGFGAQLMSEGEGYQEGKIDLIVSLVQYAHCNLGFHRFVLLFVCFLLLGGGGPF